MERFGLSFSPVSLVKFTVVLFQIYLFLVPRRTNGDWVLFLGTFCPVDATFILIPCISGSGLMSIKQYPFVASIQLATQSRIVSFHRLLAFVFELVDHSASFGMLRLKPEEGLCNLTHFFRVTKL